MAHSRRGRAPTSAWVWVALLGALATLVAVGLIAASDLDPGVWWLLSTSTTGLAVGVGGAVLVRWDGSSAVGRILCWSAATHGGAQLAGADGAALGVTTGTGLGLLWLGSWTWPLFVVPMTSLLLLVFPERRLPSPRWRWAAWTVLLAVALLCLAGATADVVDGPVVGSTVPNPFAVDVVSTAAGLGGTAAWAVAAVAGVAALWVRWRAGDATARARTQLVSVVLATVVAAYLLDPLLPATVSSVVGALVPPVVVSAIAVAAVRHRLWDLELVVRRAYVYGALTALLLLVYLAALVLLGRFLGETRPWLAAVLGGLVVAAVAEPLRRWSAARLRRAVYGDSADPMSALARLREVVETAGAPDDLLGSITEEVRRALRAPAAGLTVHSQDGPRRFHAADGMVAPGATAHGMTASDAVAPSEHEPLEVPLVHLAEEVGRLEVAGRGPGDAWTTPDRALLDHLAREVAAAVSALETRAVMERARSLRLDEADRGRRALGRELHDSLGPALAGAYLAAEGLSLRLGADTGEGRAARAVAQDVRRATTEVRRLITGIQEEDRLAGRTLAAAVTDEVQAVRAGGNLEVELDLGVDVAQADLSTDVEHAAYLITSEALTNVLRHARATVARVSLVTSGDQLHVRVRDDGTLGTYVAGVGLRSMRIRASQVGGWCRFGALDAGGAEVHAVLPVQGRVGP